MPPKKIPYSHTTQDFAGELYLPDNGGCTRLALVLHEAPGIGANVRRRCAMLSALGYAAFAADLHGGGRPLSPAEAAAAVASYQTEPATLRGRVAAALTAACGATGLDAGTSVVIGYCLGGLAALEFARSGAEVAAVASFHGLLTTRAPATSGGIRTRILVCTGALDPFVPPADIIGFQHEMTAAQARWEMTIFGSALHAFTNATAHEFNDTRLRHDPEADRRSWAALLDLMQQPVVAPSPHERGT